MILEYFKGKDGDRRQEIVVIGHKIDEKAAREELDKALMQVGEMLDVG